jgi:hypothetical protein
MKLWILLYIAGKLVISWGPLPVYVSYKQCAQAMANDNQIANIQNSLLKCVIADKPPPINSNIEDLK